MAPDAWVPPHEKNPAARPGLTVDRRSRGGGLLVDRLLDLLRRVLGCVGSLVGRVLRLAIRILRLAGELFALAFGLGLLVVGCLAGNFLRLALDVPGGAFDAVFISYVLVSRRSCCRYRVQRTNRSLRSGGNRCGLPAARPRMPVLCPEHRKRRDPRGRAASAGRSAGNGATRVRLLLHGAARAGRAGVRIGQCSRPFGAALAGGQARELAVQLPVLVLMQ